MRPDVPCDRGEHSRNIENLGLRSDARRSRNQCSKSSRTASIIFRRRERIFRISIKLSRIISSCFSSRSKSVEEERRLLPNTELGHSECERRAYELGPCLSSSFNLGLATYLSPLLYNSFSSSRIWYTILMLQLSLSFWWFLAPFAPYNSTIGSKSRGYLPIRLYMSRFTSPCIRINLTSIMGQSLGCSARYSICGIGFQPQYHKPLRLQYIAAVALVGMHIH